MSIPTPAAPILIQQALQTAHSSGLQRLDAQWLLLHVLGRPLADRAWLLAHAGDTQLTLAQSALFASFCQRLAAGEPLAYILGQQEFFGLTLAVDSRVLVPRPDTETLVEWGLQVLQELALQEQEHERVHLQVLDLGTGSGAIALALAHGWLLGLHSGRLHITAVDASAGALQVASGNVQRWQALHNGSSAVQLELVQSNWLHNITKPPGLFDLIVSNPPYIAAADPHLAALSHEPLAALVAGADGLSDLRQIVQQAPAFLRPGGWLLLEHGHDQAAAVRQLLAGQGFSEIQSRCDLAGIERCTGGCR